MSDKVSDVKFDVDGEASITKMLLDLLNRFPGLSGKKICFSVLEKSSGIAFFPTQGAAITTEKTDVIGCVHQVCLYPFSVVYRFGPQKENQRVNVKELLDNIGRWLECQKVKIDDVEYAIEKYPVIEGNRKIKEFSRKSNAYLDRAYEDGVEDWVIPMSLTYENKFER